MTLVIWPEGPRHWHHVSMLSLIHPIEQIEGFPRIPKFGYQGSKANLARRIAQLFPVEGARFIEPFCGRANVFFAVARLSAFESHWLNDTKTHKFLKALKAADSFIPIPPVGVKKQRPDLFDQFHAAKEGGRDRSLVHVPGMPDIRKWQEANVHVLEGMMCFGGGNYNGSGRKSRAGKPGSMLGYWKRCCVAAGLLNYSNVKITGWDYRKVLAHCAADDWLYIDPPYKNADLSSYKSLLPEQYEELVQILLDAKFKWVLSEYEEEVYKPLTRKFGQPIRIKVRKTASDSNYTGGKRGWATECLWANFPIRWPS